jgi:hypothetical protein
MASLLDVVLSFTLLGPWLVCSPQPGVTWYQVTSYNFTDRVLANPTNELYYDVGHMIPGKHPMWISACNETECSKPARLTINIKDTWRTDAKLGKVLRREFWLTYE